MVHFLNPGQRYEPRGAADPRLGAAATPGSANSAAHAQVLDAGVYEGTQFLVTRPIEDFTTLAEWLSAVAPARRSTVMTPGFSVDPDRTAVQPAYVPPSQPAATQQPPTAAPRDRAELASTFRDVSPQAPPKETSEFTALFGGGGMKAPGGAAPPGQAPPARPAFQDVSPTAPLPAYNSTPPPQPTAPVVAPPPPAASATPGGPSSDPNFTALFGAPQSTSAGPARYATSPLPPPTSSSYPQPTAPVPPPPAGTGGAGEFTMMFQAHPGASTPPPAPGPPAAAPAAPPYAMPPLPPQQQPPQPRPRPSQNDDLFADLPPVGGPPAQARPRPDDEFAKLFAPSDHGSLPPPPVELNKPGPLHSYGPGNSNSMGAEGEFTKLFREAPAPPSMPPPPSPYSSAPPSRYGGGSNPSPPPPGPSYSPPPPQGHFDGATMVFKGPPPGGAPPPPGGSAGMAGSGASDFTMIISGGSRGGGGAPAAPSAPAASGGGNSGGGGSGMAGLPISGGSMQGPYINPGSMTGPTVSSSGIQGPHFNQPSMSGPYLSAPSISPSSISVGMPGKGIGGAGFPPILIAVFSCAATIAVLGIIYVFLKK